jgi:hypothetical protein
MWELLVLGAAVIIALGSALPFAGGWNDGSRLATVESLVDYHTLAVDRSIFVTVPGPTSPDAPTPYPNYVPYPFRGTGDKVRIGGQFYSDKSPVPSLALAGWYEILQWATGLTARDRPDRFIYWMTVAASGLPYVVAVWSFYRLGGLLRLPTYLRVGLPLSLAVATLALTYVRQVNHHIMLLGVAAVITLELAGGRWRVEGEGKPWRRVLWLGFLSGVGYTIDLGAGPPLLACTLGIFAYRCRDWQLIGAFIGAALPAVVLHHAINYAIGGTIRPVGAVPEYLAFPGSAFDPKTMTGIYNHQSVVDFLVYGLQLLVGERGFLRHDTPLLLGAVALVLLFRERRPEWPELLWAVSWSVATWLIYALFSNNFAGQCCSIRWFVPLLAPGYYVLAVWLRYYLRFGWIFLAVSAYGAVLAFLDWQQGPWQ